MFASDPMQAFQLYAIGAGASELLSNGTRLARHAVIGSTASLTPANHKCVHTHCLKNKDVHLGLAYAEGGDPDVYESIVLYSERFVLLSSDKAGLPTKASYSWAKAARLPLCLFNHEMQNRKIVDAAFRFAGVVPNVAVETNTLSVLYEEVRMGEVCSIAPVSALPDYFLASGISIRPIEPQQLSPMSLLRLLEEAPPAVVSAAWGPL